ncbi:MAG TPA: glycosyltransferase, partial [Bacteroidia bacterium]|nr:glycosyltransferase [Bacteroidia bacterium]
KQKFELILVDDGSKDESWDKIVALKKAHPDEIRGIQLSKNFGQHNALVCGFSFAEGELVLSMDDDLQHPPSEIPKMLDAYHARNVDVIYGIYSTNKKHSAARNAGSLFIQRSSKVVGGNPGIGSSFRLMRKSLVEKVVYHKNQSHVFIDEILHWYTSRFASVEVEHHERKAGKSGYTLYRLMSMYFDILINYTAIPLKLMTWIGLISSLTTFGIGVRFIYHKLTTPHVQLGFTAQIVTILFSTSLLMFCMGIIGQYMYKIYHLQSRRPSWSISEVL